VSQPKEQRRVWDTGAPGTQNSRCLPGHGFPSIRGCVCLHCVLAPAFGVHVLSRRLGGSQETLPAVWSFFPLLLFLWSILQSLFPAPELQVHASSSECQTNSGWGAGARRRDMAVAQVPGQVARGSQTNSLTMGQLEPMGRFSLLAI
jgi:hypothetical protein